MKKGIILLVEDNPNDVELTLRALKKKKILNEVVVATDGVQALDYLEGKNGYKKLNPLLVLLDLKLPKLNGLDVLKRIKLDLKMHTLPVVMLTTSTEEEDVVRSYEYGVNSYIRKPVDFNQFTDVVAELGFYWLVLNETN